MKIQSYSVDLLDIAMKNLGEAFDYAKNTYNIELDNFMFMFIKSGYAKQFEDGNPSIICGISGCELVLDVLTENKYEIEIKQPNNSFDYSREYWCGWILAYYQWKTSLSFYYITSHVKISEILSLYPMLHEASEEKFVDIMNSKIKDIVKTTRLQEMRKSRNLSQSELSKRSGVNLRTLQQYEVGTKDINKASAMNIYALSKALYCNVEDILEFI